jgi:tetratricopeptide (TPR) repeat protein
VHIDLEEWEEALPFFDDAFAVWTALDGQLEIADCHNMIGSTLQALEVYDEAVLAYHESLKIYVSIHGRFHTDVAKVTNNYATLLDDMDEKEEAIFFYDEAIEILVKIHGEYHPQVLVALENLGSLLSDMGMVEDAEDVEAHANVVVEKLMDSKQVYIYVCIYVHMCVCVCMHACMHACMNVFL